MQAAFKPALRQKSAQGRTRNKKLLKGSRELTNQLANRDLEIELNPHRSSPERGLTQKTVWRDGQATTFYHFDAMPQRTEKVEAIVTQRN